MTFEGGDYYSERQSDGTGVSHDEAVEFAKRMAETQTVPDDVVLMVYRFKKGAGLQPTAEWSRIQKLMKEHEWMKRVLCHAGTVFERDGQLCRTYGENHDQVQVIADEDMEPFTTAVGCSINLAIKAYDNLAAELETLKAGLPTNADKKHVFIQDEIWLWDSKESKPICGVVDTITEGSGDHELVFLGFLQDGTPFETPDWCAYNSADTCRAANEVEKNKPKAGCEHCTDPDGVCCYPTYGMAPHTHDMNKTGSAIGSTVFLPRSEWPDNFDPDPDAEGCGTWTHCPKCGAPDHQDLFEKKGE